MIQYLTKLPEHVFRGTTYNFEGSAACRSKPFRCPTTANPLKAYYFAKYCSNVHGIDSVIYIAKSEKLSVLKIRAIMSDDKLAKIEEEIYWAVKPLEFYKHCTGYVTLFEMYNALVSAGRVPIYSPTDIIDISIACKDKASKMTINEINKLLKILKAFIKYP